MNTDLKNTDVIDIVNKMPVGVLVLRHDLTVVSWNLRLEQWTDLKKEEIVNKPITQFYPHLKEPKYLTRIEMVLAGGPPMVFSAQFHKYFLPCRMPNGDMRTQHTTVIPATLKENESVAVVAIEDVTELSTHIEVVRNLHKKALLEIEVRKKVEKEREKLITELTEALSKIRTLSGLLPICASCKKIRNDEGYWEQIEIYIRNRSKANFSHGICPDCIKKLYPEIGHKKD